MKEGAEALVCTTCKFFCKHPYVECKTKELIDQTWKFLGCTRAQIDLLQQMLHFTEIFMTEFTTSSIY